MDWVHGRSRVTSGASRLHHLAGVTQVAPGGPTNVWQGLLAQQPCREHPRRNDGTHRLWDLGGGGGWDAVRRPERDAP